MQTWVIVICCSINNNNNNNCVGVCWRYVPTPDDVEMYKSHKGPLAELHIVDRYMMEVGVDMEQPWTTQGP